MATYLLTQDRKILPDSTPIYLAGDRLMHAIICYTANNTLVPTWDPFSSTRWQHSSGKFRRMSLQLRTHNLGSFSRRADRNDFEVG